MSRPPVITKPQEKVLRARVRAGADIPALQFHAQQKGWRISRTVLGELLKDERGKIAAGEAAAAPDEPTDLREEVATLRREVAALRAQFAGMISLPKVKLSDALTAAIGAAHGHLANPDLEPNAVARIMGELKGLAEAIERAKKMEDAEGGDDSGLGG